MAKVNKIIDFGLSFANSSCLLLMRSRIFAVIASAPHFRSGSQYKTIHIINCAYLSALTYSLGQSVRVECSIINIVAAGRPRHSTFDNPRGRARSPSLGNCSIRSPDTMKHLLVLFALCMLSAAMVPRERVSFYIALLKNFDNSVARIFSSSQ